jgi:hypothetical protein
MLTKEQIHPLLRENDDFSIEGDSPDDIRLRPATTVVTSVLDAPDAELAPILEQLRRSLENMQGNHRQGNGARTDGIRRRTLQACQCTAVRCAVSY